MCVRVFSNAYKHKVVVILESIPDHNFKDLIKNPHFNMFTVIYCNIYYHIWHNCSDFELDRFNPITICIL